MILVDLMLPRVSGYDLLNYIRTDPELRTIPRIIVTGSAKDHVTAVADVVFEKPVDHDELIAAIHRFLPFRQPSGR